MFDSLSSGVFQSSLQCVLWGATVSLEQQVAELKMDNEVTADSLTDYRQLRSGKLPTGPLQDT